MSEKKSPFDIPPSAEFRSRVMEAAAPALSKNKQHALDGAKEISRSRRWIWMTGLGLTLSGAIGVLIATNTETLSDEDQALAILDPELLENEDLLADLDLLENLDELETWEDS